MLVRRCLHCTYTFLLSFLFLTSIAALNCLKDPKSACRCTLEDGRVFDLSPIASTDPNKPRFSKTSISGFVLEYFKYNPCYGIFCDDPLSFDSAVCNVFGDSLVSACLIMSCCRFITKTFNYRLDTENSALLFKV